MKVNFDFFGPGAKFHHVGIAVRSIESNCSSCQKTEDPIQRVSVAFITINGLDVELIEPASEKSPIDASLQNGIKLLHICYTVPDIEDALVSCRKYGFHSISQAAEAKALENRKIVWVYSNVYGLYELLEDS